MPEPVLRELSADEWPGYFRGLVTLWGGGLAEEPFIAYQRRLARAPEAVGRYRLLGWMRGRELLSAFKAYELRGEADAQGPAESLRVLGIGAVFTPIALRKQGHASAMLRRALEAHRQQGFDAALLFSDIGAAFYQRLGFWLLESTECLLPARQLPRIVGFRPAAPGDEEGIIATLAAARPPCRGLSLSRDGWVLRFQLRRLRELARARNVGEPEWGVTVEARSGRAAALLRLSRDAVDVLDAGWTSDQARESLLGGLRDVCDRARRETLRFWPAHQLRSLGVPTPRSSALAMVAPLQGGARAPPAGAPADLSLLDHI